MAQYLDYDGLKLFKEKLDETYETNIDTSSFITSVTYDEDNNTIKFYNEDGTMISSIDTSGFTSDDSSSESIDIVNNLTSTSTTSALSAYQGKVLKGLIDDIEDDIENIDSRIGTTTTTSSSVWTVLDSVSTTVNSFDDTIDELSNDVSEISSSIEEYDSSIDSLETSLISIQSSLDELQESIDSIKYSIPISIFPANYFGTSNNYDALLEDGNIVVDTGTLEYYFDEDDVIEGFKITPDDDGNVSFYTTCANLVNDKAIFICVGMENMSGGYDEKTIQRCTNKGKVGSEEVELTTIYKNSGGNIQYYIGDLGSVSTTTSYTDICIDFTGAQNGGTFIITDILIGYADEISGWFVCNYGRFIN